MTVSQVTRFHSTKYFPALDGIRALSVFAVIAQHLPDRPLPFLSGTLGVVLFFVLSGFLITTLALREEAQRGALAVRAFYVRRAFRILPSYLFVLFLYIVALFVLGLNADRREFFLLAMPHYLTFTNEFAFLNFPDGSMPYYQTWSLGVEEKFYLLWPLLGFAFLRGRYWLKVLSVSALIAALVVIELLLSDKWPSWYASILFGCLAALALHNRHSLEYLRWLQKPAGVAGAVLTFLLGYVLAFRFNGLADFVYPFSVAVLLIAVVLSDSYLSRLLSWKPLVFLGTMSYGIYLVHILCIHAARYIVKPGQGLWVAGDLSLVVTSCLSVLAAWVLSKGLEQPCIRMGRRLSARYTRSQVQPRARAGTVALPEPA